MNSITGKSTGIALLLAAGLLAALFAMGVFSSTGVSAAVVDDEAGDSTVELSTPDPEADVVITITFRVDDDINVANENVRITIPVGDVDSQFSLQTGKTVPDVSVTQRTLPVGKATVSASSPGVIIIGPSDDPLKNIEGQTNREVTVTVTGLKNPVTPGSYSIVIAEQEGTPAYIDLSNQPAAVAIFEAISVDLVKVAPDNPGATLVTMTIEFTPSEATATTITLPADYDLVATDETSVRDGFALMLAVGTTAAAALTPTAATDKASAPVTVGDTITIGGGALTADTKHVLTIGPAADVPDATPPTIRTGFINPKDAGNFKVIFSVSGRAGTIEGTFATTAIVLPPAVKLSSKTAGAAVQITINSNAGTTITSATDITVDLKKFGVPATIPESAVNINDANSLGYGTDSTGKPVRGYSGEPNSVTVDGTKITMALYSRFPGQEADAGNIIGMYTITFKQSAGITNPITGTGRATVVIKDADDIDHTDDRVVINSKVSLSKSAGPRGTAVTVSAVGLLGGGATVYLVQGECPDQGKDPELVAAEADNTDCTEEDDISLGTGTASGGKISVDIDTSSSDFVTGNEPYDKLGNNIWADWDGSSGSSLAGGTFRHGDRRPLTEPYVPSDSQRGRNQITTVDGSGRTANVSAHFTITPTIVPEDEGVQQGDELTILVEDWYYGDIADATITIGAESAEDNAGVEIGAFEVDVDRDTGDGEFKIIVPNSARLGDQELKVTGDTRDHQGTLSFLFTDAARGRVVIAALDIELEPATVVLGQQFTVNISGFIDEPRGSGDGDQDIVEVEVGDLPMEKTTGGERIGALTIDTNGDFTNTFQVDATNANAAKLKPGTYRVRVKDWSGRVAIGHITYPEPEILVDPPVSRRGTQVTLTGKNFPAGRVVHVYYDDDDDEENLLGAVLADSSGKLRMNFTVPSNAEIGDEQDIIAKSQANVFHYKAKATHALPEQELIVTPQAVSAGGRVRIEGHNMPLFTLVHIDIANINLSGQGVETDGLGSFVIENVLIPQLKPGSHTVEALVLSHARNDSC